MSRSPGLQRASQAVQHCGAGVETAALEGMVTLATNTTDTAASAAAADAGAPTTHPPPRGRADLLP
jgi:hypothetical protein